MGKKVARESGAIQSVVSSRKFRIKISGPESIYSSVLKIAEQDNRGKQANDCIHYGWHKKP